MSDIDGVTLAILAATFGISASLDARTRGTGVIFGGALAFGFAIAAMVAVIL
jgi:hypothetical protein